MENVRQSILDIVRGVGGPISPREIGLVLGVGNNEVWDVLQRLVRDLAVKKVGRGKYAPMRLSDLPRPRCVDELHPRHG